MLFPLFPTLLCAPCSVPRAPCRRPGLWFKSIKKPCGSWIVDRPPGRRQNWKHLDRRPTGADLQALQRKHSAAVAVACTVICGVAEVWCGV
jgi:hypothetical protein